jgi:hypothetical protein
VRRVLAGEAVPSGEKLVSLFETHADTRGNGPGNLEMAASLDFFHFQQIGWK